MNETITIPRPHVPYGPVYLAPNKADADYLRKFVRNLEWYSAQGTRIAGSNLTATVKKLLLDAADALDPEATS